MNRLGPWSPRLVLALAVLLLAACAGSPPVPVASRPPVAKPQADAGGEKRPSPPPVQSTPVPDAPPATTTGIKRGGGFYKDDGPGETPPPDMAAIPDATPQAEPLHRFANRPYNALGQDFVPLQQVQPYSQRGIASWYGRRFHGKRTSSGEPYDMYAMTAAHPTLPIPSYVRVTHLGSDRSVIVRINDRGPFHRNRLIDLSYTAAWKLGYVQQGSAEVLVEAIVPDEVDMLVARADRPPAKKTLPETPASIASAGSLPADVSVPAAELPSREAGTGLYLQLGAFSSLANAEQFRDYVLGELKWLTQRLTSQSGGDKVRLHLGPFESADEARRVADKIARAIKLKPFLVTR